MHAVYMQNYNTLRKEYFKFIDKQVIHALKRLPFARIVNFLCIVNRWIDEATRMEKERKKESKKEFREEPQRMRDELMN